MESQIEKAAWLHDIGKLVQRAENRKQRHPKIGCDFLRQFMPEETAILRAVENHHSDELKAIKSEMKDNDISYIVYEADNQAAGIDRRKLEESEKGGFLEKKRLDNIFNVFDETGQRTEFPLKVKEQEGRLHYPLATEGQTDKREYEKLKKVLEGKFKQKSPAQMQVNELMRILEATMSYIPSSTAQKEIADISLYDHSKLTAAFAVCMYKYFKDEHITNYKKCYTDPDNFVRKKSLYLLVSGELDGAENFINTVSSRGALRAMRGRVFYLEMLCEHIADTILKNFGFSRSCLLYSGNGSFNLLLPNTKPVAVLLSNLEREINRWLLENFGTALRLMLYSVKCSVIELNDKGQKTGEKFWQLYQQREECKYQAYADDSDILTQLLYPKSGYNAVAAGERECAICHSVSAKLVHYAGSEDANVCPICRNIYELGKNLTVNDVYVVSTIQQEYSLPLPLVTDMEVDTCYLSGIKRSDEQLLADLQDKIIRLYVKNQQLIGEKVANYIWQADYAAVNEENKMLDLQELSMLSGGRKNASGIKRLGLLKIDVDDLAAAFAVGFSAHYTSLSRLTTMSRQLEVFFKRYVNEICQGHLNGVGEYNKELFTIFLPKRDYTRKVQIISSSGDKILLAGAWDDVLEVAVDINRAFQQFTNGKLTLSAGFGMFHPKYPMAEMSRQVDELVSFAKMQGRNRIALFGKHSEIKSAQDAAIACFSWDRFIDKVCKEKLLFLRTHWNLEAAKISNKLPIGKSKLYKLLELLRVGDASINLARFAYTLARMEPTKQESKEHYEKVRQWLYTWYKNKADREELIAALELVIYHLREKGEFH